MTKELSSELENGHEHDHESSLPTQLFRRPSRSPSAEARITIKNRRKRYLDTHPEYFSSPSLELADPLAYDRLVRRFQSPSDREAEGRKKGYSATLEAKITALANPDRAALMRQRWRKEIELRFLTGNDLDFDYKGVDESEEYDDREVHEREEEERWFEKEEPSWFKQSDQDAGRAENLTGQTGVQDY